MGTVIISGMSWSKFSRCIYSQLWSSVLSASVPWFKGLTLTISKTKVFEMIHAQILQFGQILTIKDMLGADARVLLIFLTSLSE